MTTVIIDHGLANLFSLTHALLHLGERHVVSAEPSVIASASRILLPGVGAFGDVMKGMRERHLVQPLLDAIGRHVPLLGICVGMQILAERSEEFGEHTGLGLIAGVVRRLPDLTDGVRGMRVPNVGWRQLNAKNENPIFHDLPPETMAYFLHSYAVETVDPADVAATIDFNGKPVTAAIRRGGIMGYQFHPEKSGPDGLSLIRRFLTLVPGAN